VSRARANLFALERSAIRRLEITGLRVAEICNICDRLASTSRWPSPPYYHARTDCPRSTHFRPASITDYGLRTASHRAYSPRRVAC